MDLFNRKKIEDLEKEINGLKEQIHWLREQLKKPKCLTIDDPIPDNTHLYVIGGWLDAIKDYLEIEIYQGWKMDTSSLLPGPKQRKVWMARKKIPQKEKEK